MMSAEITHRHFLDILIVVACFSYTLVFVDDVIKCLEQRDLS